ncbi:MAG TPA: pyridoxal phosphate-dependent aminotransferase [Blastocatellia bacterium]|nr:pyridoxal phosphate-dependent aminotransferase [Blastocatellia bacterium]HMV87908.1 pyridoxal phosphate-dependent aminotransferase [Blastocatellia bacterium]HMX27877.1 pyridoxal phosphate-dependent aminotransferase [Blastocatellia bacterium]HMY70630.1 pyridoxal phosphate-dependent aminotransferase [Blastocatellia bacterium]HMZ21200.1 pyridoxal phosphate-dependent aminotransferase [Blastocatellia bacterium]
MPESLRIQSVQTPIIPVVGQLIREHPGTISLGQGVVWYPPPPEAFEQISAMLADPSQHKYQAVHGIPRLLELIEEKLSAENGIDVGQSGQGSRIVVTAGGNMAFINALLAVADAGDEVILQTPYYFNHEMAITMANCRAVLVPTDSNYQLQPQLIAEAITDKTRAVVTISPNNPTGAVYREADLRAVNRLCAERGIYHINDEAYEYFTYGAPHFSPGSIARSEAHTISLYSLSKAYGFASWRIGFMVIPEHLFEAVNKIQDTILICPPVVSQFAAAGAMAVGAEYCRERVRQLAGVRELVLHELQQLRDCCVISESEGAFYFFLKLDTRMEPLALVERLVKEHRVAAIPGTAFGLPVETGCYLRVAYGALQRETVAEGVGRLVGGIKTILGV